MVPRTMMTRSSCWLLACGLVLAVAGCSDDGAVEPSNEGGSGGGGGDSCSSFEADAWQAGDVVFREATDEWGLTGVASVRVNVLDIDADGWPDLLLRRGGGPDDFSAGGGRSRFLMRNSGNGSFEDVTESSGLLAPRLASNSERNAEVMCAADADNDGDVDVFMAKGLGFSPDPTSETSELMLNQGDDAQTTAANPIPRMLQLYVAIRDGAKAFLWAEYKICFIFIAVFGLIVFLLVGSGGSWTQGAFSFVSFAVGGTTSIVSGYIGMTVAVYANVRTTVSAQRSWTAAAASR